MKSQDYYDILLAAASCKEDEQKVAYRQLRELLEECCKSQLDEISFQKADLAASINYVAVKLSIDNVAQHRLHTFRLTSNAILNNQEEPTRDSLLRDVKTLAFFVRLISDQPIPPSLLHLLPQADATYTASPSFVGKEKSSI